MHVNVAENGLDELSSVVPLHHLDAIVASAHHVLACCRRAGFRSVVAFGVAWCCQAGLPGLLDTFPPLLQYLIHQYQHSFHPFKKIQKSHGVAVPARGFLIGMAQAVRALDCPWSDVTRLVLIKKGTCERSSSMSLDDLISV